MFISVFDLFKIGIGPSSSHTMGPMLAANDFLHTIHTFQKQNKSVASTLRITLRGSLSATGKGHGTDKALILGIHGYSPQDLTNEDVNSLLTTLTKRSTLTPLNPTKKIPPIEFNAKQHIVFHPGPPLPQHPNGMLFELLDQDQNTLLSETYFSIGGGFIHTLKELSQGTQAIKIINPVDYPFPFDSAKKMLQMAKKNGLSIAQMKYQNELKSSHAHTLKQSMANIWAVMENCINSGLKNSGILPGGLSIKRRAQHLHTQLSQAPENANINDWLCAYAMAVNEENAAGHTVVTAPTNGAAGVIPALLYYWLKHKSGTKEQVEEFLLTAAAIGGIIKHRSSISGAEVGCQGEVGSAAAMGAAGLCAVMGGTPQQIENAAEIALEHHLGMTCDPVKGLVQVPCIERNGFGAIKAYTAASLAMRGSGLHFMSLDNCIAAMKQTGQEMSERYKETALAGLAVNFTEC